MLDLIAASLFIFFLLVSPHPVLFVILAVLPLSTETKKEVVNHVSFAGLSTFMSA